MYFVVTGAAGFIGSNLVRALNARGETRILAVDDLQRSDKFRNIAACEISDFLDKDEFRRRIEAGDFSGSIDVVFHQGACSDTMETDGRFMMENNYRYSMALLDFCVEDVIRVNLHFLDPPEVWGIFNVGTGRAQSFNDVALATINACRKAEGEQPLGLDEARSRGLIEYRPFPDALKGKYQNFTQADVGALRRAGFAAPFLSVEEGVERYCRQMLDEGKAAGPDAPRHGIS